jgi:hypothetical protein
MGKVKYQFEATPLQELTDRAFALQQSGRIRARLIVAGPHPRLVVDGECPRCGGTLRLDRASSVAIFKGGTLGAHGQEDDFAAETVLCNAPPVTGTPPGKVGCGACFSLYARIDQGGTQ